MSTARRYSVVLVAGLLAVGLPAWGSTIGIGGEKSAKVTAVNPDGTVTATDASGRAYTFAVPKGESIRAPKPGQSVMVNSATGHVSIPGADQCCELVKPATMQKRYPAQ